MNKVEKEYKGKATIKTLVVDENEEAYKLAEEYKINVVPTLVFLNKNGSEYKRIEGFTSQKEIEEILSMTGVK